MQSALTTFFVALFPGATNVPKSAFLPVRSLLAARNENLSASPVLSWLVLSFLAYHHTPPARRRQPLSTKMPGSWTESEHLRRMVLGVAPALSTSFSCLGRTTSTFGSDDEDTPRKLEDHEGVQATQLVVNDVIGTNIPNKGQPFGATALRKQKEGGRGEGGVQRPDSALKKIHTKYHNSGECLTSKLLIALSIRSFSDPSLDNTSVYPHTAVESAICCSAVGLSGVPVCASPLLRAASTTKLRESCVRLLARCACHSS